MTQNQFTRTLPVQTVQPQTVTQVSPSATSSAPAAKTFADTYGTLRWYLMEPYYDALVSGKTPSRVNRFKAMESSTQGVRV